MTRTHTNTIARTLALIIACLLCSSCKIGPVLGGTWGSVGTPPDSRDRGTHFVTVKHGNFTIEIRQYEAGQSSTSSRFCDYWVTFRGKPFDLFPDEAQKESPSTRVNNYNNCGALVLLKSDALEMVHGDASAFMIGAKVDFGTYVPIFIYERHAMPFADPRFDCGLQSGKDKGASQAQTGWIIDRKSVVVCGTRLRVDDGFGDFLPPMIPPAEKAASE